MFQLLLKSTLTLNTQLVAEDKTTWSGAFSAGVEKQWAVDYYDAGVVREVSMEIWLIFFFNCYESKMTTAATPL